VAICAFLQLSRSLYIDIELSGELTQFIGMTKKTKIKRAPRGSVGPSKMVTIRMPLELIEKLNAASKRLGLSKNQIICSACLEKIGDQ